ncbi:MAG: hypothetical protein JST54_23530 [Deltaproteobacteria bacterium]|nr:hypothetical protein [Deltaproteobacteria bacterium]
MRRIAPLAAVALLLLQACGGGKSSPPPPPAPPAVTVIPHASPAIDTHFDVDVQVSGCDSVTSVTLMDGQATIGQATNPGPTTTFTIQPQQVNFKADGIAAKLALLAKATCANGASNTSPAAGELFLPAQQVFTGTFGFAQLSLDPDGNGLITCANNQVVRLGTDATVKQSSGSGLGFNCTSAGFAARNGASEIYWLQPATGVARLQQNLDVLQTYPFSPGQAFLVTDPTAPAVILGSDQNSFLFLDRTTGAGIAQGNLKGTLDGQPGFGSVGFSFPEQSGDTSGSLIYLQVERFDTSGNPLANPNVIATISVGTLGTANIPVLNLSPAGDIAYFIAGDNANELWACSSEVTSPCYDQSTGGGQLFKVDLPGGPFSIAQQLGSHIVVAGPGEVQFTNLSGTPQGNPTLPTGGLRVLGVYPGQGDQFYVLNGDNQGNVLEVVMLDAPGEEAARFYINTGAFGMDLDANLTPYMLAFGKLSKLLTPDQYWSARQ